MKDFKDDELSDAEFDEREAREKYPWLYEAASAGPASDDWRSQLSPHHQRIREREREKRFAEQHYISINGTNYHFLAELADDHLPKLYFTRYNNLFIARPANNHLETPVVRPLRRRLFGDLWREGELVLLFADTGLGKSALAVQIARALAGGEQIGPFEMQTEPQRVLYFDFELTDEQFTARYSETDAPERPVGPGQADAERLFPLNFIRCAPREDWDVPEEFEDLHKFIVHSIVDTVGFVEARVVIVDNLTWLAASTENTVAAQRLMRVLLTLRNQLGLSILVLAHTPKMRGGLPIGLTHLQGSKMLANFADNVVAMGRSSNSADLRYLKPIKQRNSPASFDEKNVAVMRLGKQGRMLGFTFVAHEPESRHLEGGLRGAALTEAIRRERITRAVELANGGDTFREIAEKLGVGVATVARYLEEIKEEETN
ncbi:MAG: AAA family ATPase [Pyrinomonadaceae bacterium]